MVSPSPVIWSDRVVIISIKITPCCPQLMVDCGACLSLDNDFDFNGLDGSCTDGDTAIAQLAGSVRQVTDSLGGTPDAPGLANEKVARSRRLIARAAHR